jgi:hypothetical protein
MGPKKVAFGGRAQRRNVAGFQARPESRRRMAIACWRPCHSASERNRYFSVTISRIGPTSCAMPPCTSTRLFLSFSLRARGGTSSLREHVMARQQTTAADAEFRVGLRREYSLDHFHPRPDAAGILPAAARSAQPFAQNRPSRHQAALILFERSRQRAHLPGGAA